MHHRLQENPRNQHDHRQALERHCAQHLITLFGVNQLHIVRRIRGGRMRLRQIRRVVLRPIHVAPGLLRHMLRGAAHHLERDFVLERRHVLQNLLGQIVDAVFDAAGE